MEDKYIVAIEIGSSKIRGALGQIDASDNLNVVAVQEERLLDSVRYGQVRNVEEVANTISEICRKLENSKVIVPRKIKSVYVGLSGYSINTVKAETTINFEGETEITAEIVNELKDLAADEHLGDKDIYEIVPAIYTVDNEATLKPIGRIGKSISGGFEIVEGNAGIKNNLVRAIVDRLGLKISDFIVTALAEADAVLTPDDKQLGCMFVDFGAETTTVAIYRGSVLRAMVTMPMGSRNITRDLISLNYVEEQAEQIKRSVGIVNPADQTPQLNNQHLIERPEISNYIQARAAEIVANIMAQVKFAGMNLSDIPSGIILVGGGNRLKGFSDLLLEQNVKVRIGTIPGTIRISDTSVRTDEVVDVISLLLKAMKSADVEDSVTKLDFTEAEDYKHPVDDVEVDDEEESRIGKLDDDYFDEDDDKPKKPAKQPKIKKVKEPKERKENSITSAINSIWDRLKIIVDDPEDDRFDDKN